MNLLFEATILFFGIFFLSVLQKYHFKMLYKMMRNFHSFLKLFIQFFIRFWVIVHEICHLIFWILSGAKINKIQLFSKTWGSVSFQTKNYIWALSQHYDKPGFLFWLFFNQIWIFLTSLWPLLFGIIFTYFVQSYLQIPLEINKIPEFFLQLHIYEIGILILYFLLIPSFILSFQDLKHFIISRQSNFAATFAGSFINTIIFILFLFFLTLFYEFFILFFIFYCGVFILLFFFYLLHKLFLIFR